MKSEISRIFVQPRGVLCRTAVNALLGEGGGATGFFDTPVDVHRQEITRFKFAIT